MGTECKPLRRVDANGSVTGMPRLGPGGRPPALHRRAADRAAQWRDTAVRVERDSSGGRMRRWLRLTFRQDGVSGTRDLYDAGGTLRAAHPELPSGSRESGARPPLIGGEPHPGRLPSVAVGRRALPSGDADSGGPPGGWQRKPGTGARATGPAPGGLTSPWQFIRSTAVGHGGPGGGGHTDTGRLAPGTGPLKADDAREPQENFPAMQSTASPELACAPHGLFEYRRGGVLRKACAEQAAQTV